MLVILLLFSLINSCFNFTQTKILIKVDNVLILYRKTVMDFKRSHNK